jgi:O-antigen/teichoic acid export membrane protein
VCFWRQYRPSLRRRAQSMRAFVSYGAHAYGVDAIAVLINQIDKLWVMKALSVRDLGLYAVAFGLSRVLVLFQNSVASVLFPATAGKDPRVVFAAVGQACRMSLVLALLAGLPLLLTGDLILRWLFGAEFEAAALALRLLTLDIVIAGTVWLLSQAYYAVGRPRLVVANHSIGLIALVALLFYLVPLHGMPGAAGAVLGASVLRLLVTLAIFPLVLHERVPRLLPTAADLNLAYRRLKEAM